jgi:hypothetical protein
MVNPTIHNEDLSPPSSPLSPLLLLLPSLSPPPLHKPTLSPSTDSSLSSTLSPKHVSEHKTMPSQSKFASVQQGLPLKVPILLLGDISPYVMRSYELTCHRYFNTKDIDNNKKVRKVLAGLCDNCIQDWVGIHCDRLFELSFAEFMTEFKSVYLSKAWEEIT